MIHHKVKPTNRNMIEDLLRPVLHTTWRFYLAVAILGAIVLTGLSTWMYQAYNGLVVTGDNWPVYWGFH